MGRLLGAGGSGRNVAGDAQVWAGMTAVGAALGARNGTMVEWPAGSGWGAGSSLRGAGAPDAASFRMRTRPFGPWPRKGLRSTHPSGMSCAEVATAKGRSPREPSAQRSRVDGSSRLHNRTMHPSCHASVNSQSAVRLGRNSRARPRRVRRADSSNPRRQQSSFSTTYAPFALAPVSAPRSSPFLSLSRADSTFATMG